MCCIYGWYNIKAKLTFNLFISFWLYLEWKRKSKNPKGNSIIGIGSNYIYTFQNVINVSLFFFLCETKYSLRLYLVVLVNILVKWTHYFLSLSCTYSIHWYIDYYISLLEVFTTLCWTVRGKFTTKCKYGGV